MFNLEKFIWMLLNILYPARLINIETVRAEEVYQ